MSGNAIKVSDIDDLLREINDANAADDMDKRKAMAGQGSSSGGYVSEAQRRKQKQEEIAKRTQSAVQFSTYVPPPPEVIEQAAPTPPRPPQGMKLASLAGGSSPAASLPPPPPLKQGAAITVDAAAIAEAVQKARGASVDRAVSVGSAASYATNDYSAFGLGGGEEEEEPTYLNYYQSNPNMPHVVNFLPVMHARTLTGVTGIIPKARWGHSLTSVGDALYLYGGTTADGVATNDVFQFLPKHNSFEPIHIRGGGGDASTSQPPTAGSSSASALQRSIDPPSARCHHSAVAYQGRYLVIFGGSSEKGTVLLNDVHIFDTREQVWRYVPVKEKDAKHAPTGRFGHSAVVVGSKMYVFGGRCMKTADGKDSIGLSNDVFVFCLTALTWRKRIHASSTVTADGKGDAATQQHASSVAPTKRFHHGACAVGQTMFIHGGEAAAGQFLGDTWALDLSTRQWRLVHSAADAIPRSRHALFGCGEALLAVSGVASSLPHQQVPLAVLAVAETNTDDGSARPLQPSEIQGWIPVSLGTATANTIAPTRKNFGATCHNGFVYAFGGVSSGGSQPNAEMMRCLAMDGVPIATDPFAALQGQMRNLREDTAFVDMFIEGVADGVNAADPAAASAVHRIGLHKLILQQRAPKFLADILSCKQEPVYVTVYGGATSEGGPPAPEGEASPLSSASTVPCYTIAGNSRVKGLAVTFNATSLKLFLDYLYTAAVPSTREDVGSESDLGTLAQAAAQYDLPVLGAYLSSLTPTSCGAPEFAAVQKDLPNTLASLLDSGVGATATVVFADEDTRIETTCPAHPLLLCNGCDYFKTLLRPVLLEGRGSNQAHHGVTAKKVDGVSGKRSIIIGKVPIPRMGVKHVMRYLYTRELSAVPAEDALMTMIAANGLGLEDLQAHCESIVAREEVNFDTACTYITLATTHKAPMLAELSMLTAALGFFEPSLHMADSIPFVNLPKASQATIKSIAAQLQGKWTAPPEAVGPGSAAQQDPTVYQQRMSSSKGAGFKM